MVDMSLCNGEGCKKCDSCFRYQLYKNVRISNNVWQSYISSEECMSHDYVAYMDGE